MVNEDKEYTWAEVASHNNSADLWIVISGYIYDLTKFHKEHPGGEEILLSLAGQDGTKCFEDVDHSNEAKNVRDLLRVGRVVGSPLSTPVVKTTVNEPKTTTNNDENWKSEIPEDEGNSMFLTFLVGGVAVYIAFCYYFLK